MQLQITEKQTQTFLKDYLEILKRSLQNFYIIFKKCFLGTTYIVIIKHVH